MAKFTDIFPSEKYVYPEFASYILPNSYAPKQLPDGTVIFPVYDSLAQQYTLLRFIPDTGQLEKVVADIPVGESMSTANFDVGTDGWVAVFVRLNSSNNMAAHILRPQTPGDFSAYTLHSNNLLLGTYNSQVYDCLLVKTADGAWGLHSMVRWQNASNHRLYFYLHVLDNDADTTLATVRSDIVITPTDGNGAASLFLRHEPDNDRVPRAGANPLVVAVGSQGSANRYQAFYRTHTSGSGWSTFSALAEPTNGLLYTNKDTFPSLGVHGVYSYDADSIILLLRGGVTTTTAGYRAQYVELSTAGGSLAWGTPGGASNNFSTTQWPTVGFNQNGGVELFTVGSDYPNVTNSRQGLGRYETFNSSTNFDTKNVRLLYPANTDASGSIGALFMADGRLFIVSKSAAVDAGGAAGSSSSHITSLFIEDVSTQIFSVKGSTQTTVDSVSGTNWLAPITISWTDTPTSKQFHKVEVREVDSKVVVLRESTDQTTYQIPAGTLRPGVTYEARVSHTQSLDSRPINFSDWFTFSTSGSRQDESGVSVYRNGMLEQVYTVGIT